MATTRCMPASGPHHHHTDSPCLSPHPFFMLWCGRRDARQLHVCVCVCDGGTACCIPHSASSACGCTHLCADLSGGTWLPLPLLLFTTTISCGGEGEQGGRKQSSHAQQVGRQRDDHHQPRSALACHVLLDADAKHTQYHTGPTSPTSTSSPSPPHHGISLPSLPFDDTPQRRR